MLGIAIGVILARLGGPVPDRSVEWLANARPVAAFHLRTAQGVFDNAALADRWHLILFGYTHCPDICPASLAELGQLATALGDAPVQVVFVSVDPARDTPDRLAQHAAYFHPDFVGATGAEDDLRALAGSVGVRFSTTEDGAIGHSLTTSLVGPDGRLRGRLRPGFDTLITARAIRAATGAGR